MHYKGTTRTAPQIGQEIGADAVIEGAVVRSGNRIRITAQLIRSATDRHIWAKSYERDIGDVVRLEGEIARQIFSDLGGTLSAPGRQRRARAQTTPPKAYEAFLKGRYCWNKRTAADFARALGFFQEAIRIAPAYAEAYAAMAETYALAYVPIPQPEASENARKAADQALEIDPKLADA